MGMHSLTVDSFVKCFRDREKELIDANKALADENEVLKKFIDSHSIVQFSALGKERDMQSQIDRLAYSSQLYKSELEMVKEQNYELKDRIAGFKTAVVKSINSSLSEIMGRI